MEWIDLLVLGTVGFCAGAMVAGGIVAFIIGLGIISDFADRTHTGKHILLYEDAVALGGIMGNLFYVYKLSVPGGENWLWAFGIFAGIFTGAWAMALAEMLNIFPIFVRRIKLVRCIPWAILSMALGRGIGALIYFFNQWGGQ